MGKFFPSLDPKADSKIIVRLDLLPDLLRVAVVFLFFYPGLSTFHFKLLIFIISIDHKASILIQASKPGLSILFESVPSGPRCASARSEHVNNIKSQKILYKLVFLSPLASPQTSNCSRFHLSIITLIFTAIMLCHRYNYISLIV